MEAPPGAFGPRLTALIGLLHGRYRLSARETVAFLAEVTGVAVSTGSIMRSCARVSAAVAPVDATIQEAVRTNQSCMWMKRGGMRVGSAGGCGWRSGLPPI